jgi:hypothetical protein
MTNVYTMKIMQATCAPADTFGNTDVVQAVNYRYFASVDAEYQNGVSLFGSVNVPAPTSTEGFLSYSSLTEDQIISWVISIIGTEGVTSKQTQLDTMLQAKLNPTQVVLPLPWISVPTPPPPPPPPPPTMETKNDKS